MKKPFLCCFGLGMLLLLTTMLIAQPTRRASSGEIQHAIKKLSVMGSVLYIAAHPDDENTTVLSYLANGRMMRTAYLSLTRGDGGQNLIGDEKGDLLGVIRTQELLAARRIDGPEQYFTRAVDFGYSKSPEETLRIWDKEKMLADVVWAIRRFRPDVILTRFTPELGGHGHHRASAMLAEEGFHAAADPTRFPEQLKHTETWQAKRILWDAWRPAVENGQVEKDKLIALNIGGFNALLGKSYPELAALSRSQHKCQGFGAVAFRGARDEYFMHTAGDLATEDLFDDVDVSWHRINGGETVAAALAELETQFNPENPAAILPDLIKIDKLMVGVGNDPLVQRKRQDLQKIIRDCLGLWIEAIADDYSATPGSQIKMKLAAINPANEAISLEKISLSAVGLDTMISQSLIDGNRAEFELSATVPKDAPFSHPYWLAAEKDGGAFTIPDQEMIGIPENAAAISAKFHFQIAGAAYAYETPLLYRWRDPVAGESYRPFEISPPVMVNFEDDLYVFADKKGKLVRVTVIAGQDNVSGTVVLNTPSGWWTKSNELPFNLAKKGDEISQTFRYVAPATPMKRSLTATINMNGESMPAHSLTRIEYDHIPVQTLSPPAEAHFVRVRLEKRGTKIGYVMGSGDEVPQALRQIGYQVTLLSNDDLDSQNLSKYDAIITGIRAYNTRDRLKQSNKRLLEYVHKGGTMIVQYNTAHRLVMQDFAPHPLKLSRDRVTLENAPVTFVNFEHPLLTTPNPITQMDMGKWVQERGLYFPGEWDAAYQPLFSMSDPGESAKKGSLLYAKYGKGVYIYSGISWFRQLPAGVPGAYRLFVNLISAGKN